MRCACGQKNPPEARYCLACGQLLGARLPRETRFVSVVFFDLANSTEAFRQGLSPAYRRLREALEEAAGRARARGGFVHRFLGDGVLVFFGAPRSQGLEPWRALAAAWDMVRHSPFPARAGVASGEALWGPLGSGYAGEPTLLGPPVNLAERLSKLAAPGEVLTEATTLRLAPGAEGALLGSREVKGMGQVPVYRLVRLALDLPPHRRPLLQTLEARLLTEKRLVVHGPAGSGKSFLLEVFRERRARGLPFPTVRLQRMGPEMPLRATLYRAVTEAFGAPEALLRNLPGGLAEALAYSLGLAPRPPWEKRALDEAILTAWREALMGLKTPLLLLLQDLHYPDRTLERFLERMPENLLVLAESRRPLFPARLGLEGLEAPPLLALQPALDALPVPERTALLAMGVLGEVPPEVVEAIAGPFSRERLVAEGLLVQGCVLPPLAEAARRLVPEEERTRWHRLAARLLAAQGRLEEAAHHLAEAGEAREAAHLLRVQAQALWREGHPDRALPLYQKAEGLAPPGWRASLAAEAQDALASLGRAEEAASGPRREDAALARYRELRARPEAGALLALLPALRPYPLEQAKARLLLAGLLWRAFRPQEALAVLAEPPHPGLPPDPVLEHQSLKAGLLMDLGRHAEAEPLLEGPLPEGLEARARFGATRLRLLLETGRLAQALEEGENLYAKTPHPWMAAALLSAWTLKNRFPEALFREALAHPDGRGLALLALAHRRWRRGEDPVPLFKEVLKEARRLPNPYLHHLALSSLALYLWPRAPRKAQALSQHLLYHTHKTGFLVHLEVARLLRAQLLLETGERVDHLLGFTPSLPLTRAWKAALQGEEAAEGLEGYGILGRWVRRLWRRGAAWMRARRWS